MPTQIHLCENARSKESGQDEEKESWCSTHPNWDNKWAKWSGHLRWWEASGDWNSFTKTAADLGRGVLSKEVEEKKGGPPAEGMGNGQNRVEEERKKAMKEREAQRIWHPAWRNQMRVELLGDSNWIVNWMNGRKNNQ